MNRVLPTLLILAIVLAAGAGIVFYLLVGIDVEAPDRVRLTALDAPVQLSWLDDGPVFIEAEGELDAYRALGFVHGQRQSWTVGLWRQTALGRLGEWFGPGTLPIDHLTRQLGFADQAQATYAALPDADRSLIDAYTDGLNAGFTRDVRYHEEYVLLDLEPEPWQPWHPLALERLAAWLATPPLDTLAAPGAELRSFFEADRLLRRWLHVHGMDFSFAWAVRDSAATYFYQRHVHGASALPFFQEVSMTWPGAGTRSGASLPGVPLMPAGVSETHAWALFLTSSYTLRKVADDSTSTERRVRITAGDADEQIITFRRQGADLAFRAPALPPLIALGDSAAVPVPDSLWVLSWPGFRPGTDWSTWRSLERGETPSFSLLDGSGLVMTAAGESRVLGTPATVRRLPNGIAVGASPWSRYAVQRLDTLLQPTRPSPRPAPPLPERLLDDRYSDWAARLTPSLIRAAVAIADQPALISEAVTFLRNWDHTYERASIAASIFDAWATLYRDSTGTLPAATFPDTLYRENRLRYRILHIAVDTLRARFGDNLSQWRWENVQPESRYFPVWSADTLLEGVRLPSPSRYAALRLPGSGHPTTPAWGPSPILNRLPAPAAWEGWVATSAWGTMQTRRRVLDADRFLGRYRIIERAPDPATLDTTAGVVQITILQP